MFKSLGAKILGISKNYPTKPCHFEDLKFGKKIKHKKLDITNLNKLKKFLKYINQTMCFI